MTTDKEFIENFINNHIVKSIKNDIRPLLKTKNEDGEIGGYFAVPVLVFTLVEYLGVLYAGKDSKKSGSEKAVTFIRKYFGQINLRYEEIGGLLYDMFRHGSVHEREPKHYIYPDNNAFGWELAKDEKELKHLTIDKGFHLVLSIDDLYDDLLKSVQLFSYDLKRSIGLRAKFIGAYNQMKKPKKVTLIKRRKYIKDDFQIIKKEIKNIF